MVFLRGAKDSSGLGGEKLRKRVVEPLLLSETDHLSFHTGNELVPGEGLRLHRRATVRSAARNL